MPEFLPCRYERLYFSVKFPDNVYVGFESFLSTIVCKRDKDGCALNKMDEVGNLPEGLAMKSLQHGALPLR